MGDHICDRCGTYLPDGSIKYIVHIQILSDFEGIILYEGGGDPEDSLQQLSDVELVDEDDLEEEVYQELSFVLCSACKNRFAHDPFNKSTGLMKSSKKIERLFH